MRRAFLFAALLSTPALAYNEAVHAFITRRALPDDRSVTPPTEEDLDTFRALHRAYNSKARYLRMDVYELDPARLMGRVPG